MKVLLVTGIWPPDVGGPASHAPALAEHLVAGGHAVEILTTAAGAPEPQVYPVRWVSRALPGGVRHAAVALAVGRAAGRADVVYATSMIRRAAAGALAARRPLVVKLVADEVFERSRRAGWFDGSLDEFQLEPGGLRVRALRRARLAALRQARHVFCPSAYLRDTAVGWGLDAARLSVLPNPAPRLPPLPSTAAVRAELGLTGPTLAVAGRLTAQKALDVALAALADVPDVALVVLGEGPERAFLEGRTAELGLGERVRFLGSGSRSDVLRLFRGCDGALLCSAWENFPHTVVEALAVGTPVLATAVGGVPEVVRHDVNGLLVPPGDAAALAGTIARFFSEPGLRERLAAAAAPSVAPLEEERLLAEIAAELERAAGER